MRELPQGWFESAQKIFKHIGNKLYTQPELFFVKAEAEKNRRHENILFPYSCAYDYFQFLADLKEHVSENNFLFKIAMLSHLTNFVEEKTFKWRRRGIIAIGIQISLLIVICLPWIGMFCLLVMVILNMIGTVITGGIVFLSISFKESLYSSMYHYLKQENITLLKFDARFKTRFSTLSFSNEKTMHFLKKFLKLMRRFQHHGQEIVALRSVVKKINPHEFINWAQNQTPKDLIFYMKTFCADALVRCSLGWCNPGIENCRKLYIYETLRNFYLSKTYERVQSIFDPKNSFLFFKEYLPNIEPELPRLVMDNFFEKRSIFNTYS